jgi:16S rRNA processing protein RimM
VATEQLPRAPQAAGVTVARILRPHGRRGEVAAEILTDFPERLTRLAAVELWDARPIAAAQEPRRVAVRSCRLTRSRGGQAIFHFEGSGSISDAEKLVGLEVRIPFAERMALPAGSYYVTDLIGCEVWERGGAAIGRVRDVQATGEGVAGTPVLVVDSAQGELLIPLAEEICVRVDVDARRIEVILPEGLRELNQ